LPYCSLCKKLYPSECYFVGEKLDEPLVCKSCSAEREQDYCESPKSKAPAHLPSDATNEGKQADEPRIPGEANSSYSAVGSRLCPKCGKPGDVLADYCVYCGAAMQNKRVCGTCGADLSGVGSYCPGCGAKTVTNASIPWNDLYFSLKGRIPRSTYWLRYALPYMGISAILLVIDYSVGLFSEQLKLGLFSGIFQFVALFPSIAVSAWSLLWGLFPFLNIWLIVELCFLRGTTGFNTYGEDPTPLSASSRSSCILADSENEAGNKLCGTCRFFERTGYYDTRKGNCSYFNEGTFDNRTCDAYRRQLP
jgi:uncharacterized membrane protein YhaH (DUF805 family)